MIRQYEDRLRKPEIPGQRMPTRSEFDRHRFEMSPPAEPFVKPRPYRLRVVLRIVWAMLWLWFPEILIGAGVIVGGIMLVRWWSW